MSSVHVSQSRSTQVLAMLPLPQGDVNNPQLHGIVPRAVMALGRGIEADNSGSEYEVGEAHRTLHGA